MASSEKIRIEIGFDGGQVMGAHVPSSSADELERALAGAGDGAFALDTEDGRTVVSIKRIVYVKRFAREARLGFGNL